MKAFIFLFCLSTSVWGQNQDAKYIDEMLNQFEDTVRLGELAQEKSKSLEIKRMARKVMREEKGWIDQLQRWRQKYFEDEAGDILMHKNLKVLEIINPRAFDELFLRTMLEHQNQSLALAKKVKTKVARRFLHEFADDVEDDLISELELLHELQSAAFIEDRLTP